MAILGGFDGGRTAQVHFCGYKSGNLLLAVAPWARWPFICASIVCLAISGRAKCRLAMFLFRPLQSLWFDHRLAERLLPL